MRIRFRTGFIYGIDRHRKYIRQRIRQRICFYRHSSRYLCIRWVNQGWYYQQRSEWIRISYRKWQGPEGNVYSRKRLWSIFCIQLKEWWTDYRSTEVYSGRCGLSSSFRSRYCRLGFRIKGCTGCRYPRNLIWPYYRCRCKSLWSIHRIGYGKGRPDCSGLVKGTGTQRI